MPGRQRGAQSYSNTVLLNIVDALMPTSSAAWDSVAEEYQNRTGEPKRRDGKDIKKHFIVKMCRSGKKPTGKSELTKLKAASQSVYKKILDLEHAGNYGAISSDDDSDAVDDEDGDATSQTSSRDIDWSAQDTEEFFASTEGELPSTSLANSTATPSPTPSPAGIALTPRLHNIKRSPPSIPPAGTDNKSKNCRHNPRANAAAALSSLATAMSDNSYNNMFMFMMQQQQQQSQQNQQMFMQFMQQQSQMMMSMMTYFAGDNSRKRRRDEHDGDLPQRSMNFEETH